MKLVLFFVSLSVFGLSTVSELPIWMANFSYLNEVGSSSFNRFIVMPYISLLFCVIILNSLWVKYLYGKDDSSNCFCGIFLVSAILVNSSTPVLFTYYIVSSDFVALDDSQRIIIPTVSVYFLELLKFIFGILCMLLTAVIKWHFYSDNQLRN